MYNIGDELLCIKSRSTFNLKNKKYKILDVNYEHDNIQMSIENEKIQYFKYCNYKIFITHETDHSNCFVLSDYFLTKNEIRKQKLKKICQSQ